ncbi:MAG: Ada metal-binding domain-containing protein, partial [Candidatus Sulfotelmatobacter sp.]
MTSTNLTFPMLTANAILTKETLSEMPARSNSAKHSEAQSGEAQSGKARSGKAQSSEAQRWNAVLARDAAHDGEFVFAVSSTGVYCRPSCA